MILGLAIRPMLSDSAESFDPLVQEYRISPRHADWLLLPEPAWQHLCTACV